MYSYGPPHMAKQKQDDQLELTYSSYVKTQDVTLKTCRRRWMIGRSGERGSGISVLAARHDDDDDSSTCPEVWVYKIRIILLYFCRSNKNVYGFCFFFWGGGGHPVWKIRLKDILKQEISIHFLYAFMLNFKIHFWYKYKSTNKN